MVNPSEAQTRKSLIDPALESAGWKLDDPTQVGIELPVDGYDAEPWNGITDYALYQPNGNVIAVVEAKRQTRDPRIAQQQALHYVTEIEKHQGFRPYVFLTNGYETYFWDSEIGDAKRRVYGFFSLANLERLKFLSENKTPLLATEINVAITDRAYQHEAIRRVCDAFENQRKRKALIVMATGTGKTRTAMSIVDVFLRSNQAQKILFVADRDPLVRQALNEGFKRFLPDEPCTRIKTSNVADIQANRLYVSTLQTLSKCFEQFTPSFFDIIIFDEVHRSIFNKFYEVVDYFDARMIGLTATPAQFIDRNTFKVFDCQDNIPTALYTYEEAVDEGYLVEFELYQAQTHFQRAGIRGANLSEEDQNALLEQGIDPDELDYSGTELEKTVSNRDTVRKQWEEIWEVSRTDQSGQLPGKTIVFAATQKHAFRLAEVFEEMHPQYADLIRVITHETEYRGQAIEAFKHDDKPRIAISVDMLDTGIDVPEVVNLVFMKPVHSVIKLWQMIGRGTRSQEACQYFNRLPDGKKDNFLVVDFWENKFNREAVETVSQSLPVLVSTFNMRLDILEEHLDNQQSNEWRDTVVRVRGQIARIPLDSFSVRKVMPTIEAAWTDDFWLYMTEEKMSFLRLKVGPLLRYISNVDVEAETFTGKVERLKWQILIDKDKAATAKSIAEDVGYLPNFVVQDRRYKLAVELVLSQRLAEATVDELNIVIDLLAPQMRNRRAKPNQFVELDLPDFTEMRAYIYLVERGEQVYVEDYREQVERRILDLVRQHPTIQALERGELVSDLQLIALERTLREQLTESDLELNEQNIRKAYNMRTRSLLSFLRGILELENLPGYEDIVHRQFEQFITTNNFNHGQIRFLRAVRSVFLEKRRLELDDLYTAPSLVVFGNGAVGRLFSDTQIDELLAFTSKLAA